MSGKEAEKKAAEEKKRKEEERVKKELEKAKKEAEEKRLRELEEKRRLKEQRKAEEEARKKIEENKKLEEEKLRKEAKELEARKQAEERRIQQEQIRTAKAAPWSQSSSTLGMSLADIQKSEREKRAQETALQMQRLQEKETQQQQQQQQEKPTGIQLSWARKPVEPRKVKSLAEIQAEEQERLAKQAAESRLQKEKEAPPVINNASSIWNSQSLTWASASATNLQWSSLNNSGGFWDDSSHKQTASKPSTVSKSNSTNSVNATHKQQQPAQKQQTKNKTKKEESSKTNHNNNNNAPSSDEFTNWCYKTLSNITTSVDIPTFVTFLRDIESALDVREYCKEYLGESTATQQFATNFLEKRRSFKPKNNAHKDDMCSPAPAITPSLQHSTEFQEVKGKNKKNKKSKMLKVDSRILGFNVTSAPDRINVGDRDYGDNS
ncbi:GRB10-interacting GYF protein 2 [Anoplophora glabripennis]|uniref:GRB10-interacting GYF protein 2 n=1 Tax=Anoplophora glabripennis TaxID=217634 RepID=UPI000874C1E8|nr:GRB10-interacting GYF protein 2 [Anoplophora glabripennis]